MKMNLLTVAALVATSSAFGAGHGVEKILPADGHNAQVLSAELDQIATGQKLISDDNEGPKWEDTDFVTKLGVTVTYQSKDDNDAPATGSGSNGEFLPFDSTLPQVMYTFDVTAAQIAAIKAKTLDPKSLVSVSIEQETVQIDNPNTQAVCSYDNDTNVPLNGCVEPAPAQITVSRPVLFVDLNQ
jgi:hypothetical protein